MGPQRTGFQYIARAAGRPVACAGLALDNGVAKLWGGAVVPDYRGRGAYRALLHARLDEARARAATLALVKARIGASSPILRKAGFAAYGRERHISLPLT